MHSGSNPIDAFRCTPGGNRARRVRVGYAEYPSRDYGYNYPSSGYYAGYPRTYSATYGDRRYYSPEYQRYNSPEYQRYNDTYERRAGGSGSN
jgi:hypothetical protein